MTEYQTIIKWLHKEPDVDLVIPYIQEQKAANTLTPIELDSLRTRVMFIKKYGHHEYQIASPGDIAREMFEGSKIISEERKRGGCHERG